MLTLLQNSTKLPSDTQLNHDGGPNDADCNGRPWMGKEMTDKEEAELDRNVARREALVQRLCAVMGWEYATAVIWAGLRKVAEAEATVIGLNRLEEIVARLDTLTPRGTDSDHNRHETTTG